MAQKKGVLLGLMIVGALAAIVTVVAMTRGSTNNETANTTATEQTQGTDKADIQQGANMVTIKDYTFTPAKIQVKKGTTVTWTNQDVARHNVSVIDGQPEGGPEDGPLIGKGETYEFTFNTVGTYEYQCDPHPYMRGAIEVTE